jgi:hypothetical protein
MVAGPPLVALPKRGLLVLAQRMIAGGRSAAAALDYCFLLDPVPGVLKISDCR